MLYQSPIRAQRRLAYNDVAVYVFDRVKQGEELIPAYSIADEDAQVLLQDLWDAGLRPRDIGTAGHLAATQEHLKHITRVLDQVLPLALRK